MRAQIRSGPVGGGRGPLAAPGDMRMAATVAVLTAVLYVPAIALVWRSS